MKQFKQKSSCIYLFCIRFIEFLSINMHALPFVIQKNKMVLILKRKKTKFDICLEYVIHKALKYFAAEVESYQTKLRSFLSFMLLSAKNHFFIQFVEIKIIPLINQTRIFFFVVSVTIYSRWFTFSPSVYWQRFRDYVSHEVFILDSSSL